MATSWSDPIAPSRTDNGAWKSKITSSTSEVDFKHVSEAPENLLLTPEDFEIVPEEVQSDKEEWAVTSLFSVEDADQWTAVTGEND